MTERSAEGVLLETERLVLRQFTMSDVDNLAELDADPDVMRFITGGLATSRDEIKDNLLPGFMAWYRRPGGYGCWAADQKPTGAFLDGSASTLAGKDPAGRSRSGSGFASRRGKGYAPRSRALMHKGFTEFGARRVVAETMAVNLASAACWKAGLNFIRIFHQPWPYRVDGREFGDVEYAVTKDEWEQQNGLTAG